MISLLNHCRVTEVDVVIVSRLEHRSFHPPESLLQLSNPSQQFVKLQMFAIDEAIAHQPIVIPPFIQDVLWGNKTNCTRIQFLIVHIL